MKPPSIDVALVNITPKGKLPLLQRLADEITASYRRSLEGMISTGGHLIDAKNQLEPIWGKSKAFGWKLFLVKQCDMSDSYASKLISIAENEAICNPQNWPKLPLAVEALYGLAHSFAAQQLQEMLDKDQITQKMTYKQIQGFIDGNKGKNTKRKNTKPNTLRLCVTVDVMEADEETRVKTEFSNLVQNVEAVVANSSLREHVHLTTNLQDFRIPKL
jgi:hypothetical protein